MTEKTFEPSQVHQFFRLLQLGNRGAVVELRAFDENDQSQNTFSGYFDNEEAFVRAAKVATEHRDGVYVTINVLNPQLLCRSANRARAFTQITTSDGDILKRRYLPIRIDALRPVGTPSSDEQHEAVIQRCRCVFQYLRYTDYSEPIVVDSGNGAYLLLPIDFQNDDASKREVQKLLEELGEKFNDEWVKVDASVFNAAQIMRLPGTQNRKGDNLPGFPHRMCRILYIPSTLRTYTETSLLEKEAECFSSLSLLNPYKEKDFRDQVIQIPGGFPDKF